MIKKILRTRKKLQPDKGHLLKASVIV
jgi:hypothetical protein